MATAIAVALIIFVILAGITIFPVVGVALQVLTGILTFFSFIFILAGLRIIKQYERGVRLRLGNFMDVMQPGLKWIIPGVDSVGRMDIRQRTIDMEPQEVLSKDNVNLKIDGVVFYTVEEPDKAILHVENIRNQLIAKATSELKEIIGSKTMQESLTQREEIGDQLKEKLNDAVKDLETRGEKRKDWGVEIKAVQINNVILPHELTRAMAKQAEAEREKIARVIKAEGEFEASKKLKEASIMFKGNPSALRLRELQTYQEIGAEQNSLIIVVPDSMTSGDGKWTIPLGKELLDKTAKKNSRK
ncbi:MAG: slipin family protein [Candidatus Aenigmarchaeota archaeon]|nr:slipin family protein [Candidatus Aenigmarchaeota archaeon]